MQTKSYIVLYFYQVYILLGKVGMILGGSFKLKIICVNIIPCFFENLKVKTSYLSQSLDRNKVLKDVE